MAKFPLPQISRAAGGQAHPFPFRISLQTQEFLQATLFHASFADIAAGELVRQPDGIRRAEEVMTAHGLEARTMNQGWDLLSKYKVFFESSVFQSALIAFNSQWDWYIRRLSKFIKFARVSCRGPSLSPQDEKRLSRASRLPLREQLDMIESAAGVALSLEVNEKQELTEMSLVRNLGLHNRWEIDADYLGKTSRPGFVEGDVRIVQLPELHNWHSLMIRILNSSAVECAKQFHAAPDFEA